MQQFFVLLHKAIHERNFVFHEEIQNGPQGRIIENGVYEHNE